MYIMCTTADNYRATADPQCLAMAIARQRPGLIVIEPSAGTSNGTQQMDGRKGSNFRPMERCCSSYSEASARSAVSYVGSVHRQLWIRATIPSALAKAANTGWSTATRVDDNSPQLINSGRR